MKKTRTQIIRELVEHRLDEIDSYSSFEQACDDMLVNGLRGYDDLDNDELLNEYENIIQPDKNIILVED